MAVKGQDMSAAAEEAAAEAGEDTGAVIEVVTDDPDLGPGEKLVNLPLGDGATVTVRVQRRWKRFKFIKAMAGLDMLGALEILGATEDQVEQVEEADVDEDEFAAAMEALATTVLGSSGKKTQAPGSRKR